MNRYPTKIAFAGDWHGNLAWAVPMVKLCAEAGVEQIYHAGDFGFRFTLLFLNRLEDALTDAGIYLYFVDGNHDHHEWIWDHEKDDDGFHVITEHIRAIPRAHRWSLWDISFMGLGGAVSVDKPLRREGVDWWPTERLRPFEALAAVSEGHVDVILAHDAPEGVPIPSITLSEGLKYFQLRDLLQAEEHRVQVREIVDQVTPKLYVHGHYHVAYNHIDRGTLYVGLAEDATVALANIWIVDPSTLLEEVEHAAL